MKKTLISSAVFAAIGFVGSSNAALTNDGTMVLSIDGAGTASCLYGGTYPNCTYGAFDTAEAISYFNMDGNPGGALANNNGIVLGTAQPFDGNVPAPGSAYDGSGSNITAAWDFFGNQGTNFSASTVSAVNDTTIDMSGWRVAWGEVPEINMGSGGTGTIACGTCNIGDGFVLDYAAVVPDGDPSGFGGVLYELHLEGTITAVPIPAAVWLFGSGLLGLAGVARRRNKAS